MKVDTEGIKQTSYYPLFFKNYYPLAGKQEKGPE